MTDTTHPPYSQVSPGMARPSIPSAAPAAGQAGLAKLAKYHVSQFARVAPPAGDYYLTADVQDLFATFAASGAAGAEQATDSLRALCAEMVKLHAERSTVLTIHMEELGRLLAAPVAADTEQATDEPPRKSVDVLEVANERRAVELTAERMADNLSEEEKAALDRLDKPEWRAASNLKLRAILAVEVANCIRMGAKIENLQDELRATDGYRQGYKDGAADAASTAEVENDWRSIWDDRSPIQGEGVLATNGETVIAARWLATGWAEHGLDDVDIMDYLPEGWVTHWKPMPAAHAAPAADTNAQGEE